MTDPRLARTLQFHLGWLVDSIAQMQDGYMQDAIRIAVGLRVMFYDSPMDRRHPGQGPLVRLLGAPDVQLRSSAPVKSAVMPAYAHLVTPGPLQAIEHVASMSLRELPREEWLDEVVMISHSASLSRWDIIDVVAHKEGGAHVSCISHQHIAAINEFWGRTPADDVSGFEPIEHLQFHYLHRFAVEVLLSPELLALAGPPPELKVRM